ncbi:hypothetical protein F5Y11DRAFT_9062 [Daldinia sp. FL1419]|nr:hypothetical protein F5Y11DRAFT_9062 [Daldinia sp. FL1419]
MADFNQVLAGGAHFVARAIEYQVRQAVSTSTDPVSTPFSSASGTPTPSAASPPATPEPSTGGTGNGDQNGGQSTNSPLLFFVALGFGVVFTNLWIIVGVKYCFRYNARNRQLRGLDENGEPINLENMPARPHRRRREKKLMTMDEVNDKFPMMKYKAWVSARASEGLPTAGGVSAPPSRANSVRSVEGIVPEMASKEQDSNEDRNDTSGTPRSPDRERSHASHDSQDTTPDGIVPGDNTLTHAQTAESIIMKDHDHRASMDEDDDDEHIDAALPPELVGTQGDTCAICIDTLEDNDDIRGLTCGHAFHAVCIDPWLTNRRASCPLCKADYYTPKPRPPPGDVDPANPASHNADSSRNNGVGADSTNYNRQPRIWERNRSEHPQHRHRNHGPRPESQPAAAENAGVFSRVRGHLPAFRLNGLMRRDRNGQAADASGVTASGSNGGTETTPSQLEAGVRPSTTAVN